MRLLLIRHGQTPSNVEGILDAGYPGPGLTALGRQQAGAIPAALAREDVAGLHVSRLLRTHETAAPFAAALGTSSRLTEGLEEIRAGEYEMHRDADAVRAYQENCARWAAGDLDHALPGGETGHAFFDRYAQALRHIAGLYEKDATVALVSHGAAIRVFSAAVTAGDGAPVDLPVHNTGMVTLVGHPGTGWELEDWRSMPLGGEHLLQRTAHDVTADQDADAVV